MASAESIVLLLREALVSSIAPCLVLLLRHPLRRAFGARVAYAAWVLVPVVLLAALLPSRTGDDGGPGMLAIPMHAVVAIAGTEVGVAWHAWLLAVWLAGAAATALLLTLAQVRFRRALGGLSPHGDGAWICADAMPGLPATIGLFAPRIVLPADFEFRYDAVQRTLVLAHERAHIARGDLGANFLAAALRCVFWFNPLLHMAARFFRQDQELACDATVVACNPDQRRCYGDALLHAQFAVGASPLGCHFGFGHPLKERIDMLKRPVPTTKQRLGGSLVVAALAMACAYSAWAAQPLQASDAKPAGQAADSTAPQVQATVAPKYPKSALDEKVEGRVILIVDIAADGSVATAEMKRTSGDARLDAAALEVAKQWQFKPAYRHGKPVASRVLVPIDFRMHKGADSKGDAAG